MEYWSVVVLRQFGIAPRVRGVGGAFRARPLRTTYPGLKPWAKIYCRCAASNPNPADAGCDSKLAQNSSTPTLHHSAPQNSRTRTTTRTRTKRLTSGTHANPEFASQFPRFRMYHASTIEETPPRPFKRSFAEDCKGEQPRDTSIDLSNVCL